jgi:hypothetical protein
VLRCLSANEGGGEKFKVASELGSRDDFVVSLETKKQR